MNGKGEIENVQTERNSDIWFDIEGKQTKIGQEAGETQRERKLKTTFSQLKPFFFFNMNYIEHFSQHYEELRETGDNLTKVFVPRWSHCMLTNKNLVCCGYPIGELTANLTLNGLWEIPLGESGQLLLLALLPIPNLITCKFQSDLRNGSKTYY